MSEKGVTFRLTKFESLFTTHGATMQPITGLIFNHLRQLYELHHVHVRISSFILLWFWSPEAGISDDVFAVDKELQLNEIRYQ